MVRNKRSALRRLRAPLPASQPLCQPGGGDTDGNVRKPRFEMERRNELCLLRPTRWLWLLDCPIKPGNDAGGTIIVMIAFCGSERGAEPTVFAEGSVDLLLPPQSVH